MRIARREALTRAISASLAAIASRCAPAELANALTSRNGYSVVRNLRYADRPRGQLDLYLPAGVAPSTPLVVFFYGGRWQSGSKEDFLFVAQAFVSRGMMVAVPDIRLYPEVRFPVFLEDAAEAVSWLMRDGKAHGLMAGGPLVLAGHSSGAYVAAMLAFDRRWLGKAGGPCPAGFIGIAGPYDFLPLNEADLRDLFGADKDPARLPQTQPIVHVDRNSPPSLLLTGADDITVRPGNSQRLASRLHMAGVYAKLTEYEALGHIGIIAALAAPLRGIAPVLDDATKFIAQLGLRNINDEYR
jgi:acetyl esterase/lipase